MGFAEEANVIFFNTAAGIFTLEWQSKQARKVFDNHGYGFCNVIPVVSFYTPVPRGEHQDPLPLGPSEEPGGEEHATKEGGLVNDFESVSHDVEIRDSCYGQVVPECASMEDKHGHALPSEAQEVTAPLGDLSNSPLNEELVKRTSTTSKDDDGNSKTSGSNVEDAAPTL